MLRAAALASIAATPLMLPEAALAQEVWQGTTGDYNASVNWLGGTVPGGADTAFFVNNGSVTTSPLPLEAPWLVSNTPAGRPFTP